MNTVVSALKILSKERQYSLGEYELRKGRIKIVTRAANYTRPILTGVLYSRPTLT